MKFSFFEALSKEEAQEYLDEFLLFGKNRGIGILEENTHFTLDIDFSMESLSFVLKSSISVLRTVPREPDETVPEWIRATEEYKKGLFDFDESSKSVVLAGAYYLGETFVRNYEQLSWATGNIKYAEGNMPVVTGFKFNKELAPILIAENMFGGVISGISREDSIDTAIDVWSSKFFLKTYSDDELQRIMKFSFFEALSKEEAQEYLDEFLLFGKNRGMKILAENLHFTVDVNFSIESLSPAFKALLSVLITIPREPDLTVPEFIRNTESYKKNLFDFDEPSKSVVLAAAYYLGETFVRNYEQLSWATGNTKYAEANMPVVTKFKHNIEMAPILIMENMFGRVISKMGNDTSIDTAIQGWVSDIPN